MLIYDYTRLYLFLKSILDSFMTKSMSDFLSSSAMMLRLISFNCLMICSIDELHRNLIDLA